MASLQEKKVHGHKYWYVVESRRVNGKPRPVVLAYLGKAENILALKEKERATPVEAIVLSLGEVVPLLDIATQMGVVDIIDSVCGKRNQGVSVGNMILLAALNRATCPVSKKKLQAWYSRTVLPSIMRIPASALSSQRFWDAMGYLGESEIEEAQAEITKRIISLYDIDTRLLFYDTTNFATYIDTDNPAEIPQRGRSKQKRSDLKLVGLSLLSSSDHLVPLLSRVYPGNMHDTSLFPQTLYEMTDRYRDISGQEPRVSVVFDMGNNSKVNQGLVDNGPYHFVGALPITEHRDLMSIPKEEYTSLRGAKFSGTTAYRVTKEIWGGKRTVVLTHSEEFFQKQVRGVEHNLAKAVGALSEIRLSLDKSHGSKRGRKPTRVSTLKKVEAAVSKQHMKKIIVVQVGGEDGKITVDYEIDTGAFLDLKEKVLGKRLLFTDNHHFSTEEIITAYRGLAGAENSFRQMKDPHFVSFTPVFHWTDPKIRVHGFYCVLALTLVRLLERKVEHLGFDLSDVELFEDLAGIKQVVNIYPSTSGRGRRPRVAVLSSMSDRQGKLADALDLAQFASQPLVK